MAGGLIDARHDAQQAGEADEGQAHIRAPKDARDSKRQRADDKEDGHTVTLPREAGESGANGLLGWGLGDAEHVSGSDAILIDQIEQIRGQNNRHWMNLVRLAFDLAPERARAIMQEIARCDGEVRRLTQELGQ